MGSCVLLRDRTAALAYPKGRIDLAICENCALIQNVSFDEPLVDYTSGYEESQGYSATFVAYADSLIDHLNRRYSLTGSTVVEPGCGKGEFLVRLCETIGCRGIGVDPAHVENRVATTADVRFEKELFTRATTHAGRLVLCRHTLEHISGVSDFLGAMRVCAAREVDSVVVVEVPDAQRILDEGAFWDVYYEHASYFTDVSLRASARAAGLQPDEVGLWFDGQYLVLEASVGPYVTDRPDPEAVRRVGACADRFGQMVTGSIRRWRDLLAGARQPVLWGASSKAVGFLSSVDVPHLVGAVDVNPHKQGSFLAGSGTEILAPERLRDLGVDMVVVMNPIYVDEITATTDSLGLAPTVVAC